MRTHTTQDDKIFAGTAASALVRVWVKDAGGTFRDLTALYGWDFLDAVEIKRSLDQPAATCTLTVRREIFKLALSTEIAGSRLNVLGGGTRLLDLNRDVKVEAQLVPSGAPAGATWTQIFYGRIDKTNSASDPMTVECSDLIARLQQAWIKTDLRYGVWDANRRVISGTVVLKTDDDPTTPTYGWWQAQSTFTTGATEPAWPAAATPGATTIADNGGTWKCVARPGTGTPGPAGTPMETAIQQLLDDNLGVNAWTLYCPVSPAFAMNPWDQQKESLFVALQKCADLMGWNLEYRYTDSPPNATAPQNGWANPPGSVAGWYLTLYDPKRTNVASSYTLDPGVYDDITSEFSRDISGIRTDVEVSYLDSATLDASGNPTRKSVFATDAAALAAYGDLYMGIAEGTAGGIYTTAQANALASAIVSDLAQSLVQTAVRTPFAWWSQLNDVITLSADGLRSDAAMALAISTLTHTFRPGERPTTEWGLRAKPASRHRSWHDRMAMSGLNGGPIRTLAPRKVTGISTIPTINGASILFQKPTRKQAPRYSHTQLHLSVTNGFTPSSATLISLGKTGRFDLAPTVPGATGALTPGTTYYGQLLHVDELGNALASSTQFSFVAGYTNLAHINPNISQNFSAYKLGVGVTFANNADFVIPFDSTNYTHIIAPSATGVTITYAANILHYCKAVISAGMSAGDAAQIVLQQSTNGGSTWSDVFLGPTAAVVSQGATDILEPNLTAAIDSAAADRIRMVVRPYALSNVGSNWTLKIGGPKNGAATTIWIASQQFA